ncbi:MAG: magnesium-translocating P-type ATPase [Gemmatimonadales bacterium]
MISDGGLTSEEAGRRLAAEGPNSIPRRGARTIPRILLAQVSSPLVLLLIAVAIVSRLLGEGVEAAVILAIVVLNAAMAFVQEYRAERALQAIQGFVTPRARVCRDGEVTTIPSVKVVRGDLVLVELGDLVPADLALVSVEDLSVDEATLTGESLPVVKEPGSEAYLGSTVVGGSGTGAVRETGSATLLGRSAGLLAQAAPLSDFERNIRRFSDFLVQVIFLLTAFVFLANAVLGKGWFDSFLFAVALAVGITPEVLPAIVTITLANGALRMARDRVVVKRLASVEDLGNVDVLCCDKTGTLTLGEFALHGFVAPDGAEDPGVLLYGALSGAAERGVPRNAAGNPTDRALWSSDAFGRIRGQLGGFEILDRSPFDFHRRLSSVLIRGPGGTLLLMKGAAEAVLDRCTAVGASSGQLPLDEAHRKALGSVISRYEEDGLRVLAIADRPFVGETVRVEDESDLCLGGFLLFMDPPKPDVRDALAELSRLGVAIKILSGDSAVVTRRICGEAGITVPSGRVVTGSELAALGAEEVRRLAAECGVFARLAPDQKAALVAAIRASGHVVGFLGDGVNDAPALRAADVGISVDSGADIAKEAADVILLRKSLRVLAGGIVEGRKTFANITKYILNTISANFGNMSTVALSSIFLPFIPLLPSQILLNNFLSDMPLITIATDRVDASLLERPRRWNIAGIAQFMVVFGLLSAVFDLALIGGLLSLWHAGAGLFRTAWFLESAASEILVTFAIRTRMPFWRSRPGGALLWSSVAVAVVIFALPLTPFGQEYFSFVPVPAQITILILLILLTYFVSAEASKRLFLARLQL